MSISDLPRGAAALPEAGLPQADPAQADRGAARPHFLCIGAQKAGTTWLHSMLAQNESVFVPPIKEIHFFDFIYLAGHRPWVRKAFRRRHKALSQTAAWRDYVARLAAVDRKTDEWYAAVFDHERAQGRVTGEITPAYSILPVAGVRRVRAVNPDVRLLFIIRDPIDRALSHLRMAAERGRWGAVGPEVLERPAIANVVARSAYRRNIERWEKVFPREQILYLAYRRIRAEPEAFLREVEAFIGAAPWSYAKAGEDVHKSAPTTIAPEVVAALEARLGDDRAWLAARFGEGFLA